MACTNTNATVYILLVTLIPSLPLVSMFLLYLMLEILGYEDTLLSSTLSRLSLNSSRDHVVGEVARSAHLASTRTHTRKLLAACQLLISIVYKPIHCIKLSTYTSFTLQQH